MSSESSYNNMIAAPSHRTNNSNESSSHSSNTSNSPPHSSNSDSHNNNSDPPYEDMVRAQTPPSNLKAKNEAIKTYQWELWDHMVTALHPKYKPQQSTIQERHPPKEVRDNHMIVSTNNCGISAGVIGIKLNANKDPIKTTIWIERAELSVLHPYGSEIWQPLPIGCRRVAFQNTQGISSCPSPADEVINATKEYVCMFLGLRFRRSSPSTNLSRPQGRAPPLRLHGI